MSQIKGEITQLLSLGGFELHKWLSNIPEILENIPEEHKMIGSLDFQGENNSQKALGLNYNIGTDSFVISSPEIPAEMPKSKREILSYIGQLYDPLGLVSPITLHAKLLMQKIWSEKTSWDSPPSEGIGEAWAEFYKNLTKMSPIKVDRNVLTKNNVASAELTGFADASSTSYGCCVYFRVTDNAGNTKTSLLFSKSKVNPLSQKLTTPRAELNSAVLLSKCAKRIHDNYSAKLNREIPMHLYSDSQIVLSWLKININKLIPYVANRVRMILELTNERPWAYVNTKENPADLVSRGVQPHELGQAELWFYGPPFIQSNEYTFKPYTSVSSLLPELKSRDESSKVVASVTAHDSRTLNLDFLDKFSDLNKRQRVLAYILRFYKNLKDKSNKNVSNFITSSELDESLNMIIKFEQQKYFKSEIACINADRNKLQDSIKSLHPFKKPKELCESVAD
ncbi:uncharacterized protein [Battus philenor]|uniref:uncharacterized protein n=1 Tax=Battus philenor TaxID=42288 RepID=UPI0035D09EA3